MIPEITLNQMAFLFSLILIGYLLTKSKILSPDAAGVLSKLESWVFIPALVAGTFISGFTVEKLSASWQPFLLGFALQLVAVPLALLFARLCSKDTYTRRIYTYGLAFSNFGFMGNAVVGAIFPEYFMDYLIFTLPFWVMIYLWGVPSLLIADADKPQTLKNRLRAFLNPMFIAMLVGMLLGISGIRLPAFLLSLVETAGSCMSPVAMLLTGITVAGISLKKTFTTPSIYAVSLIRLLLIPALLLGVLALVPVPEAYRSVAVCAVASAAMPLGLNTVVIPSAYGKDTSVAAGMALISHLFSCLTIPAVFALLMLVL